MEITSESFKDQIPYYLTQGQKDGLLKELKAFINNSTIKTNYFSNDFQDKILQGDGWGKLQIRNFYTGDKISILGIILSNSCDVAPDNERDLPTTGITFASLIPLSSYMTLLKKEKIDDIEIEKKIDSIKKQRVTSIFFLPAGGYLQEDHIALFDDIYTMPSNVFNQENKKSKAFTLSMFGFYLFVFKLSIHFCRFQENVARN